MKINQFNDIPKDRLDEWIFFLKNEEIKEEFQAKGLKKAKEVLDIMNLSEQDRTAYERYVDDLHYQASMYQSSYVVGRLEGQREERTTMAQLMKKNQEPIEKIMQYTQLSKEEIESL